MVTHIDGRPLNSGHRKLKAINRIYSAYVNQKGAPYVNAKNKPIISEVKKPATYTINAVNDSLLADRDKIIYRIGDNVTLEEFPGNDETQKTITNLTKAIFESIDNSYPKIKFAVKRDTFNIKSAKLNTGKNVTVDTINSTVEFDYDILAAGILSITFDDNHTDNINIVFLADDTYINHIHFRLGNLSLDDKRITVKDLPTNNIIIDNQPMNSILYKASDCYGFDITVDAMNTPFEITLTTGDGASQDPIQSIDSMTSKRNVATPFVLNGQNLAVPDINTPDVRSCRCKFRDGSYATINMTIV